MFSLLVITVVFGLASAQCGQKPGGFNIVGGEEATPNEWPWQLSLQSSGGSHFCGATLVDTEWAITAAHCVDGSSPGSVRLVAGEHDLSQNSGFEQILNVDSIDMHPDYSFPDYDVAVLHLSTPATITDQVDIACTPNLNEDYSSSTCWISGWGHLQGGGNIPNILNHVQMDVLTTDECQEYWGNTVDDGIVCVYDLAGGNSGDTGACQGDSGGPISCLRNGAWDVIGAASFVDGSPLCDTTSPSGYCRLTYVWDFIQDITGLSPGN